MSTDEWCDRCASYVHRRVFGGWWAGRERIDRRQLASDLTVSCSREAVPGQIGWARWSMAMHQTPVPASQCSRR